MLRTIVAQAQIIVSLQKLPSPALILSAGDGRAMVNSPRRRQVLNQDTMAETAPLA
ncbi:hypothetical protein [Erwinia persicina]|uniref:hypothetical protein n=1 Tax=Erwinia persicina TaxID=55211 RepID=UPI0017806083|nr:hypothetical protein [Erwinia persicina]MBD8162478.1 hypothetical protein [Erwinia persicina]MBD8214878.1 hypothetical protein [Erwinia persicina]